MILTNLSQTKGINLSSSSVKCTPHIGWSFSENMSEIQSNASGSVQIDAETDQMSRLLQGDGNFCRKSALSARFGF